MWPGSRKNLVARFIFALSVLSAICSGHVILKAPSTQKAGAVASESEVCSQVGIDLIKRGVGIALRFEIAQLIGFKGNAADALVGTSLCVGVIGMYKNLRALFHEYQLIIQECSIAALVVVDLCLSETLREIMSP